MRPVQGKTKIKRSRLDGYGVFAVKDIRAGEVIEQMPALCILDQHVSGHGKKDPHSPLNTHCYFPTGLRERWVGTGTSSFYNASRKFNAEPEFFFDIDEGDWITIYATRGIKAGEEITLDYLQEQ